MKKSCLRFSIVLLTLLVFIVTSSFAGGSKYKLADGNFKVASLSYIPVKWDKKTNLETIERMVDEAVKKGAECIITPEGGLEGYLINVVNEADESDKVRLEKRFKEIAETDTGESVTRIKNLAKKYDVDIVLGFLEREGEILYNTSAWINSDGKIIHKHRKTQMAQEYFEPEYYHPGHELKAFDTGFGRVGIMICYERQVPEVARVLALDGARIIFNPSYGSRGEWNLTMLRARARDNDSYIVFTHPQQTLVINDSGEVVKNDEDKKGPGIVLFDISLNSNPRNKLAKRRTEAFAEQISQNVLYGNQRSSKPKNIKVATVQMHSSRDMDENIEKMVEKMEYCAKRDVRVVLFSECVTTGYFSDNIKKYTVTELMNAKTQIEEACKKYKLYAIFGTPFFKEGVRFNMAIVVNDKGESIYQQAKIQLVGGDEGWAEPGNWLNTFKVDDNICSVLICHDSRYPELVRLPVLNGSRLVFYMSWESDIKEEHKIAPYRAQVVARAVENNVYVVQSNAPYNFETQEGSHGQSRIVDPNGQILKEAAMSTEEILIADLDLSKSNGNLAKKSLRAEFLKEWWNEGIKLINNSY